MNVIYMYSGRGDSQGLIAILNSLSAITLSSLTMH